MQHYSLHGDPTSELDFENDELTRFTNRTRLPRSTEIIGRCRSHAADRHVARAADLTPRSHSSSGNARIKSNKIGYSNSRRDTPNATPPLTPREWSEVTGAASAMSRDLTPRQGFPPGGPEQVHPSLPTGNVCRELVTLAIDPYSGPDLQVAVLKQLLGKEMRGIVREEIRASFAENWNPTFRNTDSQDDLILKESGAQPSPVAPVREVGNTLTMVSQAGDDQWREDAIRQIHFSHSLDGFVEEEGGDDPEELHEFVIRMLPCLCARRRARWLIDAWMGLGSYDAPEQNDWMSRFVDSRVFQMLSFVVILANVWFMIVVANEEVENPWFQTTAFELHGEIAFILLYSVELACRLWRYGWYFFADQSWRYNWVDLFLIIVSIYFLIISDVTSGGVSWMRTVRIFKVVRALRIFKLASVLDELRIILTSFLSSFATLVCSLLLLALVLFLFALLFVQRTAIYFRAQGDDLDDTEREKLLIAFGGVHTAMVTLYMCTTGGNDWAVFYNSLIPTGIFNQLLFLFFIAFTQIALINTILGIFVDRALKNMAIGPEELAMEHVEMERVQERELRELCNRVDTNRDGFLTVDEWNRALRRGRLSAYLATLGIRVENIASYFHAIVNESGEVDIQRFVRACMRMKGTASSFDLHVVQEAVKSLERHNERRHCELRGELTQMLRARG